MGTPSGGGGAAVGGGLDNAAAQFVGNLIDDVAPGATREQRGTIFDEVARTGAGGGELSTAAIRRIINANT